MTEGMLQCVDNACIDILSLIKTVEIKQFRKPLWHLCFDNKMFEKHYIVIYLINGYQITNKQEMSLKRHGREICIIIESLKYSDLSTRAPALYNMNLIILLFHHIY